MNTTRQILATKLYLPSPTTTLVARPRLLDRLHAVLRRPLTTVIAPAGFGKTTLVSTWAAGVAADGVAAVAWLTLDAYDDDPSYFWTAVIAALQTIDPALGREVLPFLNTMTPSSPQHLLTPLINQLAEHATSSIVLILDDYHVISASAIHAALTFIVDHLPPHIHVILTSRSDPPLPVARLRARGQLVELRAADLRFTPEETASFLNDVMGLQLAADTNAALEARTEGWIAGLHLSALSMQNHTDRAGFVRSLTGSHHYILDYLVEEVLQRQPTPIRTFLLQTAILDQLCASLCNAVTGSAESVTALEVVAHANLFLIPLDDERRWYRYHHLFVEMLRARLAEEQPAYISELHRRASDWYARHAAGETAMQGEAIRHALAAGDGERAVAIIDEAVENLWARNEVTTLRAWLTVLPTAVLRGHPRQAIRLAQILLVNGSLADVPPLLDVATAALGRVALPSDEQTALRGKIAVVRSHLLRNADHIKEALALAEQALALLPDSAHHSRALAALGLALAYHFQGTLPVADASYRDAITLCEAMGDRYFEITARCMHSRLLIERGDLRGAEAAFQHALQRATLGARRLPIAGWALIGLGTVAYARNDLQFAEHMLTEGFDLVQRAGIRNARYHAGVALIQLRLAQSDLEDARETAARLSLDIEASHIPHFIRWAAAMQALVDLRRGDLAAATRWAHTFQPRPDALIFTDKAAFAIFVRVLLATGQADAARRWIAAQRAHIAPFEHIETQVELHLLDALALFATGEQATAGVALESALALAAPAGFVRLFLDAGTPIGALLARRPQDDPQDDPRAAFVEHLLTAFGDLSVTNDALRSPEPPPSVKRAPRAPAESVNLIEPLSERELEVLRFMAAGFSNQAIADRLIISVPTVKKHGSNIFAKLQATNRSAAVARARDFHLLS